MENLVVSLDTAQKLKAAGFPQGQTAFGWWDVDGDNHWRLVESVGAADCVAAATAQEIADQLPADISLARGKMPDGSPGDWIAYLGKLEPDERGLIWPGQISVGPTMAEALAALYLKLREGTQE